MFSLRPYHSLKEEEESPYGKSVLYTCTNDIAPTLVTCSTTSTAPASSNTSVSTTTTSGNRNPVSSPPTSISSRVSSSSPATTTAAHLSCSFSTTITTSGPPPKSSSPSTSSSFSGFSSPFTLQSIKAAWRSLTSLSFSSSRLPHLERDESSTTDSHQHDYRYTQFPTTLTTPTTTTTKRQKESTFHHTHLHISPSIRTYTHPHRTPSHPLAPASSEPLTLVKCLRRHREKQQARAALARISKSDNALHQRIGPHLKSSSDQNLHKVCIIGGSGNTTAHPNSIFSNVQLSGGSGDSCGSFCSSSSNSSRYHYPVRYISSTHGRFPNRSRSLERGHAHRIHTHWTSRESSSQRHTRSLERNHKFRIDLRLLSSSPILRDQPPDHPAPPPPISSLHINRQHTQTSTHSGFDTADGSGGSLSLCSTNSSSSGSSCGGSLYRVNMESSNVSGSFINKPPRGWLHPDQQLAEEGICYGVRYIGALEINTSMKSLNFDTRSLIAKECISKVCEAAGLKTADRKRKVVKSIGRILGERPLMEHAGSNITLTITSTALTLTTLESCQVVACHEMPNISFASGGDPDTLDFIAYVAKDSRYGRACFVLECGGGLAQDVITTIGQAFELRFKEYLKRTPASVQYTNIRPVTNGEQSSWPNRDKDEKDYYNDLPGKVPPDPKPPPVPPLPQYTTASNNLSSTLSVMSSGSNAAGHSTSVVGSSSTTSTMAPNIQNSIFQSNTNNLSAPHPANTQRASSDNLIDLTSEAAVVAAPQQATTATTMSSCSSHRPVAEPEYVNDAVIKQRHHVQHHHPHHMPNELLKDPFDMQPFSMQLTQLTSNMSSGPNPGGGTLQSQATNSSKLPDITSGTTTKSLPLNQRLEIQQEIWFHGPISRKEAEQLMKQDGDFLVRESQGTAGQYVLTGMQNSTKKHLLLVDPEGVVRTKSRTFDSVNHLINYHRNNELPIVSAESALVLRNPVPRPH